MSRKIQRVPVHLDAQAIRQLPIEEILAILRGADDLIMRGGRSLLAKLLKGSRNQDVLKQGLERNPAYGYYQGLPEPDVLARIDWVILHGLLAIEYDHRLPMLVFTDRGWEMEKEALTEECLRAFDDALASGQPYDVTQLKDRNRGMILLLLDKILTRGDRKYIPLLEAWAEIDYQKVRQRISQVIDRLS